MSVIVLKLNNYVSSSISEYKLVGKEKIRRRKIDGCIFSNVSCRSNYYDNKYEYSNRKKYI